MKKFTSLFFIFLSLNFISCSEQEQKKPGNSESINFDFGPVDAFMKKYVKDGKVKYEEVLNDKALDQYTAQVKNTEPYNIENANERLAFWINAYNAFTIKLITDYYPVNSILDIEQKTGANPWKMKFIEMAGGRKFSLDEIEKEIIIPDYKDPRIHYALVCAAESCPVLISEAYTQEKLNAQLDRQAEVFLNDRSKNYIDKTENELYLSTIFKWYARDFVKKDSSVIKHVLKYINPEDKDFIISNKTEDINYLDYSWKLNDVKETN
ncbi:MAG: DUF547 domain-containing protein [Bacteroidetes bacterium]|nr:DUF547 domain-containing protein [Bacteroidota bacterium]